MKREVYRRVIGATGSEHVTERHLIDLRVVAWAAAVETMQVNLVARGWVGLFGAMLDHRNSALVWQGQRPGGDAEIKRAYSALMGRFFGRAVLRAEHKIKWLRQVSEGLEVEPGVRVRRKAGAQYDGDLPDWVGWDRVRKMWAVCEAKGSRNASGWIRGTPAPVKTGLEQIDRIEVRDSGGVLASEGWVVASRWGTVDNKMPPVIMTVDPRNDGRVLSPAEVNRAEAELRVDWYADLLKAVGQDNVANRLKGGAEAIADDESGLAQIGDTVGYAALAIDGAGLFPLVGEAREDLRRALVRFARDSGQKTAVIIIDHEGVERARTRQIADSAMTSPDGFPQVEDDETETSDLARGIDSSIISIDGVTLIWEVDQIDLTPV